MDIYSTLVDILGEAPNDVINYLYYVFCLVCLLWLIRFVIEFILHGLFNFK